MSITKVLLLGGTGAMGVPLAKDLVQKGFEVFVSSRSKHSDSMHVHYLQGDGHQFSFLTKVLELRFDVIVDFLIYDQQDFTRRMNLLLNSTKQYVFFSSSRVYAQSKEKITEGSARLLDVTDDAEYLKTSEYALKKARQEDILLKSKFHNWTIIRPYITYNNQRLQLGVLEKEEWLYRALHHRTIVFSKNISQKMTSLTFGDDVATRVAALLGKKNALSQIYQVVTPQIVSWSQILTIYLDEIEKNLGFRPCVKLSDDDQQFENVMNNKYQVEYDRLFDRKFDSAKIAKDTGIEANGYVDVKSGIHDCLQAFINNGCDFKHISWKAEAYFDRLTHERAPLHEIPAFKDKCKYLIARYTPYFYLFKR